MDKPSIVVSGALIVISLAGLWFVSSSGVEEGLAFGPGRWWLFFVVGKAFSACAILGFIWFCMGLALRRSFDVRRAARVAAVFR